MKPFGSARFGIVGVLIAAGSAAAQHPETRCPLRLELPPDAPVTVISHQGDDSQVVRGSALAFEVKTSVVLRNHSSRRLRGISLAVVANERTAGGVGLVRRTGLDVAPERAFTVEIQLQLYRPLQDTNWSGPRLILDGAMWDGLEFYGPDRWNSRFWLTAREYEALPDRLHFKDVLAHGGIEALRRDILAVVHGERASSAEALRLAAVYVNQGMPALLDELH
jgi:hypothetical protein